MLITKPDAAANKRDALLKWAWRLMAVGFVIMAAAGWIQAKRSRVIHAPTPPPSTADWDSATPVRFEKGLAGAHFAEYVRMAGRRHVAPEHVPTLEVAVKPSRLGYLLHGGIHRTEQSVARLEVRVNGELLGAHTGDYEHRADVFEVAIPGRVLSEEGQTRVLLRNVGEGAWYGRLLLIPYGALRVPLQMLLPPFGFLLLWVWAVRRHRRGRPMRAAAFGLVAFFVYFYSVFSVQIAPLAGLFFSDCDELVSPFLNHAMEYDLTKHMLCLPVIHLFWRIFDSVGWAEMIALAGAFSLVAALNVMVAYLVFRKLVPRGLAAVWLTLLYMSTFSIWLYSSIYETFVFSSLMVNLFLLVWLSWRPLLSWNRVIALCGLVVLCGLAHPPLLVFLGAVLYDWWRTRERAHRVRAVAGCVLLVALVGGGFLGARLALRNAYLDAESDLRTGSIGEEYADAGEVVAAHGGRHNLRWRNVGNMVFGQCVYAVVGAHRHYNGAGGWRAGFAYLIHPLRAPAVGAMIVLWGLAWLGVWIRPRVWAPTLSLALLVLLPYMAFFFWFNPEEMLLYSPPMMALMLGWLAWAGRPVNPRLFDGVVGLLVGILVITNTLAIAALR